MKKSLAFFAILSGILSKDKEEEVLFNPPKVAPGAVFFDTFQDGLGKWSHTASADGEFVIDKGTKSTEKTMARELELLVPEPDRKYGLVATEDFEIDTSKGFVFQYEVRFHSGITCGGAYMKLLAEKTSPEDFDDKTRYAVMFGPDKCERTNKVHLIASVFNPVTAEWVEHHLIKPPEIESDRDTHLYTLVISPGQVEYEIFIDNKSKKQGKFDEDFDPPFQPEKEIEDPDDKKPKDWDVPKKIADPKAVKPDDWDDDAPKMIKDPKKTKPECWHDSEPDMISNPEVQKPDGWNDKDDGEFSAPLIKNPVCTKECGCGEYQHPLVRNPDYKGKWRAPKIDNPEYKGTWSLRKIPNPAFYVRNPADRKISDIKGLAIDIWTISKEIGFDNVYLGTDVGKANKWTEETWKKKNQAEIANKKRNQKKKEGSIKIGGFIVRRIIAKITRFFTDYAPQCVITMIILIVSLSWFCGIVRRTPNESVGKNEDNKEAQESHPGGGEKEVASTEESKQAS